MPRTLKPAWHQESFGREWKPCPQLGFRHEQTSLVGQGTVADAKLQVGTAEALRVHHPEWESSSWKRKGYTKQSRERSVTWNGVRLSMTILWLSSMIPYSASVGFHFSLHSFTHSFIHGLQQQLLHMEHCTTCKGIKRLAVASIHLGVYFGVGTEQAPSTHNDPRKYYYSHLSVEGSQKS